MLSFSSCPSSAHTRLWSWHCSSGMKSQRGSTDAGMLHAVFIRFREHASGADSKEVAPLTTPPLSTMCARVVTEEQTRHMMMRWDHVYPFNQRLMSALPCYPLALATTGTAWRRAGTARWLSTCEIYTQFRSNPLHNARDVAKYINTASNRGQRSRVGVCTLLLFPFAVYSLQLFTP